MVSRKSFPEEERSRFPILTSWFKGDWFKNFITSSTMISRWIGKKPHARKYRKQDLSKVDQVVHEILGDGEEESGCGREVLTSNEKNHINSMSKLIFASSNNSMHAWNLRSGNSAGKADSNLPLHKVNYNLTTPSIWSLSFQKGVGIWVSSRWEFSIYSNLRTGTATAMIESEMALARRKNVSCFDSHAAHCKSNFHASAVSLKMMKRWKPQLDQCVATGFMRQLILKFG